MQSGLMWSFPRCITLAMRCKNTNSTFVGWHPIPDGMSKSFAVDVNRVKISWDEISPFVFVTNPMFEKHVVFAAVSRGKDGPLLHLKVWRHSETVAYVSLPRSALNKRARVLTKCSQRSPEVSWGQLSHYSPSFPDGLSSSYSRSSLARLRYYHYPGWPHRN